ncbi:MAG TPA: alpha/beta hydrolase [Myxococcales bacterium LLY-WYZ-16_1]|nr:alpha/beta hydrolase [Myxococcales bacterium LLY-WYZ-16_1]
MRAVRWGVAAVGMAAAATAVWLWAPRPRVAPPAPSSWQAPSLADLDRWVAEQNDVPDVIPGTEARIRWVHTSSTQTPWSIVHVHGFSASRQETAPLAERVADAIQANLFETRLTGHGRTGAALGRATARDWIEDAQRAAAVGRVLGERVAVLASSTGATLAALLSAHRAWQVDAQIWLSPNFGPRDPAARVLTLPWARIWVPWVAGKERSWEPENEAQGRYWTTRYPVGVLFEMQALVEAAQGAPLEQIETPVLMFHHKDDPVVDVSAMTDAFARLGSARRRRVAVRGPGDGHVLAGRILSPDRTAAIAEDAARFLRQGD